MTWIRNAMDTWVRRGGMRDVELLGGLVIVFIVLQLALCRAAWAVCSWWVRP